MDKLIDKLNFDFVANQKMVQLIGQVDGFKGKWEIVGREDGRYLHQLRKIATIESIGSSTRIEGATLTDIEVQELLDKVKITRFETRDQQEVIGYYEVLELIYGNYADIPITEAYIKQLHQLLLKYSDKDTRHRGGYKQLSNKVVATYPTGEQRTIFSTTDPSLVEFEMNELTEWVRLQFEGNALHPLVVAGVLVYEFLSIHPFQDGNGRLSRLLTTLCLLRSGYEFVQYVSFENHIEQHKKEYYEALMSGQRNRNTSSERIDAWMLFFLESMVALTRKLEAKYQTYKLGAGYLNERQRRIKEIVAKHQPVKISDLQALLPDVPVPTLKGDLQYMRKEQVLLMMGQGRGTVYVVNPQQGIGKGRA